MYTEPWWLNVGYNPVSMVSGVSRTQTSVSSQEGHNGDFGSNEGLPVSFCGLNMKYDDAVKDSGTSVTPQSDRNSHQEHQDPQQASHTLHGSTDNYLPLTLPSQLEHNGQFNCMRQIHFKICMDIYIRLLITME